MRRICYISGTRADFGLMRSTLQAIREAPRLELRVIATGMHLSGRHGRTVEEIRDAGLEIAAEVPVELIPETGATMARNLGTMLREFVDAMERDRSDVMLLLGDRGEMLAGALAALHLNIPIAHIHGGERSGTVDEPIRHAISKLAHLHFVATRGARRRLIRMGESSAHIHVTGAPGLDGLTAMALPERRAVAAKHRLDPERPFALMVFHPVLQEAERAREDAGALLAALDAAGIQVLALMPNADAGSAGVRAALDAAGRRAGVAIRTHLPREDFIAAMARADLMVGNSSAGIIEAASFGTPVLNIGRRQNLRERNANVRDVAADATAIASGVTELLGHGRFPAVNIYGDGRAGARIVRLLTSTPFDSELLHKVNSY